MDSDPVTLVAKSGTSTTNPSVWDTMIQILPDDLTEMRRHSITLVAHLTCL